MARLAPGLFGLALFVLWVWAVLDVIATDRSLIRNLDKTMWLILVIIVPSVGAVAWLALGRPVNAGFTPGSTNIGTAPSAQKPAPLGIEDSDRWSASTTPSAPDGFETTAAKERRLAEWEAKLDRREDDLDES